MQSTNHFSLSVITGFFRTCAKQQETNEAGSNLQEPGVSINTSVNEISAIASHRDLKKANRTEWKKKTKKVVRNLELCVLLVHVHCSRLFKSFMHGIKSGIRKENKEKRNLISYGDELEREASISR